MILLPNDLGAVGRALGLYARHGKKTWSHDRRFIKGHTDERAPEVATSSFAGADTSDDNRDSDGSGKQSLRYFTLRTPADAERATVKRLVRKAFRPGTGGPSRSTRRTNRVGS